MKRRPFVQWLAVTAVLILAWVVWPTNKPRSGERVVPPSTDETEAKGSLDTTRGGTRSSNPFWQHRLSGASLRTAPPPDVVQVGGHQVLAMVNQTPVQLRDLMPIRSDELERALTHEQYDSRLQRAIEMELIVQAARVQGVGLTAAQKHRLGQIARDHQSDLEHYKQYGLTWSSVSPEQVEFERRFLEAQMLEQNLVARKASVSPSPDSAVQARYEQARLELLDQLQASANITMIGPAQ